MGEAEELQDWELLHDLGTSFPDPSLTAIEGDESDSLIIRSDYFAIGSNSSDMISDSPKIIEFGGKHEEDSRQVVGLEGIEVESKEESGGEEDGLISRETRDFGENHENDVSFEGIDDEIQEIGVENKTLLDSRSDVSEMENLGDQLGEMSESSGGGGNKIEGGGALVEEELRPGEEEKRVMVWLKLPFELLKFCVFRVNPVWTISIAAAVMGFVIMKKRLSNMRRKTRSIPIKLTVEDKKVSQFMMRATRLNEAFSVVRSVPVTRPLLPAAGVTPWPMLNSR